MGSIVSALGGSSRESLHQTANQFVFHPHPSKGMKYPKNVRQFNIASKNGTMIEVICIHPQQQKCLTNRIIIWSHGNGCINEEMYSYLQLLADQFLLKVVSYDYQGYGNSKGECSEENCYDDLESVVNHFITQENHKKNEIYLIGHSLGTGVTIDYVSKSNWTNAIVLISPYESMLNVVVDENTAYTSSSLDMFNSKSKLDNVKCPVKIYHGKNDNLIKVKHSENLFKVLSNKTIQPTYFENCGHNDILQRIRLDELMGIIYNNN